MYISVFNEVQCATFAEARSFFFVLLNKLCLSFRIDSWLPLNVACSNLIERARAASFYFSRRRGRMSRKFHEHDYSTFGPSVPFSVNFPPLPSWIDRANKYRPGIFNSASSDEPRWLTSHVRSTRCSSGQFDGRLLDPTEGF